MGLAAARRSIGRGMMAGVREDVAYGADAANRQILPHPSAPEICTQILHPRWLDAVSLNARQAHTQHPKHRRRRSNSNRANSPADPAVYLAAADPGPGRGPFDYSSGDIFKQHGPALNLGPDREADHRRDDLHGTRHGG